MAKLLDSRHNFRLQPNHRTSYSALAVIIVFALVTALFLGNGVSAAGLGPYSGAVGISATVNGAPPGNAARILVPTNGSITSIIPITVSGLCPASLLISIYSNSIFIGSTTCSSSGSFSLQTALFIGQNTLIARDSDALGQYGPDSAPVNVTYSPPSTQIPGSSYASHQLIVTSTTPTRGGNPGDSIPWQINIVGGTQPYAVNWDWGDGTTDLVSQQNAGTVTTNHTYKRAGTYSVVVKITDGAGNSSIIQLVMVVNGPVAAAPISKGGFTPGTLISIWPLYIVAALFLATFFFGERREMAKLKKRHLLASSFAT